MADDGMRPIVIKRVKKVTKGGHGGAWKIAYADFVTAMMAFFLLMWLLGSTSKGDLVGISDFFKTPLRVSLMGGSSAGDATSVIKGGGPDLSSKPGQVARGEASPAEKRRQAAADARDEDARLAALKGRIESVIEVNPMLKKYQNQLILDITSEGLRIQIVDEKNRPMFALASAELQPYTKEILHIIGMVLNEVPNKIGISGHTDATPYFSDAGYSNWELSADRANASRREMVMGGLQDEKILRVVGLAAAAHLDSKDPFNPINRRISIIVMNKRTEDAVRRDAAKLELPAQHPAAAGAAARDALNP